MQIKRNRKSSEPFKWNENAERVFLAFAHCTDQYYIHASLQSSSHIFLRIDRVQSPLRQPYTGPHKVLSRTDKTITIDVNGRKTTVSLDRVKPAHLLSLRNCM
ncbi:gag-Pol polyprotein [Trichonephila clavipes]|nr:gag-Pol polyprotein [Trichonephila clavipes]